MVLPHLVKPILDFQLCDSIQEDPVTIGRIFMPTNLQKLIRHSNLAYITPPPSPEKPLRLTTPAPKSTKTAPDLPSTSGGSRPGLRSGDSLALIQQMAELNEKVVILTTRVEEQSEHAAVMRGDIHKMVDLLTKIVSIFRGEELASESAAE